MPTPARDTPRDPCTSDRREFQAVGERDSLRVLLWQVVAEPAKCTGVLPPIGEHFHPQIEVYRLADELFDFRARCPADLADPIALRADEYPFLTLALDVQDRADVDGRAAFPKLVDFASDAVGHLVFELLERRLANELTD